MDLPCFENVDPGWWGIVERTVAKIKAIDPTCEIHVKEKFGLLRIRAASKTHHWSEFWEIEDAAELESSRTCELCGKPGHLRLDQSCLQTLCDGCAAVRGDNALKRIIIEATEKKWMETHQ